MTEARRLLERAEALVSCELEVVPSARGQPGEKPPGIPRLIAADWLKEARAYLAQPMTKCEGELVAALEGARYREHYSSHVDVPNVQNHPPERCGWYPCKAITDVLARAALALGEKA